MWLNQPENEEIGEITGSGARARDYQNNNDHLLI